MSLWFAFDLLCRASRLNISWMGTSVLAVSVAVISLIHPLVQKGFRVVWQEKKKYIKSRTFLVLVVWLFLILATWIYTVHVIKMSLWFAFDLLYRAFRLTTSWMGTSLLAVCLQAGVT